MPFDLGAVVPLGTTVRDSAGSLANAGNMALTIGLPDSTTVTVNPVAPASTGTYTYDYTTAQAGRHTVRWVATGINAGAYTDAFDVREQNPPSILSLADGRRHLKKTDTADDEEIRSWIGACTRAVEMFVGPVVPRTVTERVRFTRARSVALTLTPCLALVSATSPRPGGTSYDVDDLDLDLETGLVEAVTGGLLYGPLDFTYRVGRLVVGDNITSASRIILQHLWRTRQGPARPQRGTDDFDVTEPLPGLGFAIPNRAVQLLEPDRLPPQGG